MLIQGKQSLVLGTAKVWCIAGFKTSPDWHETSGSAQQVMFAVYDAKPWFLSLSTS